MNEILNLKEKRAYAWDAAKKFLDTHTDANGLMSAEDAATYDKMEADIENYGKQIERLERQKAIDDELNKNTTKPIVDKPNNGKKVSPRATDEYKDSFWNCMRNKGMTRELYNALEVGTDSEGGYLVPDEFENRLIQGLNENNIIRGLATVIKTEGERKIPVVASHGDAYWTDEEAAYTESDEAFTQVTLTAHKATAMIKVSEELLEDSAFNMESYIATEFGRRIGAKEEEAFVVGTGTGMPTGFTATATLGVTADKANQLAMDEVIDMYYALGTPYRKNAVWIFNDTSIKSIRKLKTANGDYMWQPSVQAGQPDMLLNRPVYTSSYMDSFGANKICGTFGDMSYYWIADRGTRSFKRLNELFSANGQIGFQAKERVDGKLILAEAIVKLKMGAS